MATDFEKMLGIGGDDDNDAPSPFEKALGLTSNPTKKRRPRAPRGVTREDIDKILSGPGASNVRKFFDEVKRREGGQPDLIVGGKMRFDPRGDHPNKVGLRTKEGPSTAAGNYQITGSNWYGGKGRPGLKHRLGAKSFDPENQLRAAMMLLGDRDRKALEALEKGDFDYALEVAKKDWAALPGSTLHSGKLPKGREEFLNRLRGEMSEFEKALYGPDAAPEPALGKPAAKPIYPQMTPDQQFEEARQRIASYLTGKPIEMKMEEKPPSDDDYKAYSEYQAKTGQPVASREEFDKLVEESKQREETLKAQTTGAIGVDLNTFEKRDEQGNLTYKILQEGGPDKPQIAFTKTLPKVAPTKATPKAIAADLYAEFGIEYTPVKGKKLTAKQVQDETSKFIPEIYRQANEAFLQTTGMPFWDYERGEKSIASNKALLEKGEPAVIGWQISREAQAVTELFQQGGIEALRQVLLAEVTEGMGPELRSAAIEKALLRLSEEHLKRDRPAYKREKELEQQFIQEAIAEQQSFLGQATSMAKDAITGVGDAIITLGKTIGHPAPRALRNEAFAKEANRSVIGSSSDYEGNALKRVEDIQKTYGSFLAYENAQKQYSESDFLTKAKRHFANVGKATGDIFATGAESIAVLDRALQLGGQQIFSAITEAITGRPVLIEQMPDLDQTKTWQLIREFKGLSAKDPLVEQSTLGQFNTGLVSAASFLIGGAVLKGSKIGVATLGALQQVGGMYNQMREAGVSDRDAVFWSSVAGIPLGASEIIGIGGMAARYQKLFQLGIQLNDTSARTFLRELGRFAKRRGLEASREVPEEFLQEFNQSGLGDALVKTIARDDVEGAAALRAFLDELPNSYAEALPAALMAAGSALLFTGGLGTVTDIDVTRAQSYSQKAKFFNQLAAANFDVSKINIKGQTIDTPQEAVADLTTAAELSKEANLEYARANEALSRATRRNATFAERRDALREAKEATKKGNELFANAEISAMKAEIKTRKALNLSAITVASVSQPQVAQEGNEVPSALEVSTAEAIPTEIKVGGWVDTPKGKGKVVSESDSQWGVELDSPQGKRTVAFGKKSNRKRITPIADPESVPTQSITQESPIQPGTLLPKNRIVAEDAPKLSEPVSKALQETIEPSSSTHKETAQFVAETASKLKSGESQITLNSAQIRNPIFSFIRTELAEQGYTLDIASRDPEKDVTTFVARKFTPKEKQFYERSIEPKHALDQVEPPSKSEKAAVSDRGENAQELLKAPADKIRKLKADGTAAQWINRNEGKVKNWGEYLNKPVEGYEKLKDWVKQKFQSESKDLTKFHVKSLRDYLQRMADAGIHDVDNELLQRALNRFRNDPEGSTAFIEGEINKERTETLANWKNYITRENPTYAADPFFQEFIWSAITKLRDTRPDVPPALDRAVLAAVYNDISTNPNSRDFAKLYAEKATELMLASAGKENIVDVPDGTWVKIPKTDQNHPDFEKNTAAIRSMSCSSWCTSQGMEKTYITYGDFWMLIKGGKTVMALRFQDDSLAEIQGQENDGIIPQEYLPDLTELLMQDKLELTIRTTKQIVEALKTSRINNTLPKYKEELDELKKKGNAVSYVETDLDGVKFSGVTLPRRIQRAREAFENTEETSIEYESAKLFLRKFDLEARQFFAEIREKKRKGKIAELETPEKPHPLFEALKDEIMVMVTTTLIGESGAEDNPYVLTAYLEALVASPETLRIHLLSDIKYAIEAYFEKALAVSPEIREFNRTQNQDDYAAFLERKILPAAEKEALKLIDEELNKATLAKEALDKELSAITTESTLLELEELQNEFFVEVEKKLKRFDMAGLIPRAKVDLADIVNFFIEQVSLEDQGERSGFFDIQSMVRQMVDEPIPYIDDPIYFAASEFVNINLDLLYWGNQNVVEYPFGPHLQRLLTPSSSDLINSSESISVVDTARDEVKRLYVQFLKDAFNLLYTERLQEAYKTLSERVNKEIEQELSSASTYKEQLDKELEVEEEQDVDSFFKRAVDLIDGDLSPDQEKDLIAEIEVQRDKAEEDLQEIFPEASEIWFPFDYMVTEVLERLQDIPSKTLKEAALYGIDVNEILQEEVFTVFLEHPDFEAHLNSLSDFEAAELDANVRDSLYNFGRVMAVISYLDAKNSKKDLKAEIKGEASESLKVGEPEVNSLEEYEQRSSHLKKLTENLNKTERDLFQNYIDRVMADMEGDPFLSSDEVGVDPYSPSNWYAEILKYAKTPESTFNPETFSDDIYEILNVLAVAIYEKTYEGVEDDLKKELANSRKLKISEAILNEKTEKIQRELNNELRDPYFDVIDDLVDVEIVARDDYMEAYAPNESYTKEDLITAVLNSSLEGDVLDELISEFIKTSYSDDERDAFDSFIYSLLFELSGRKGFNSNGSGEESLITPEEIASGAENFTEEKYNEAFVNVEILPPKRKALEQIPYEKAKKLANALAYFYESVYRQSTEFYNRKRAALQGELEKELSAQDDDLLRSPIEEEILGIIDAPFNLEFLSKVSSKLDEDGNIEISPAAGEVIRRAQEEYKFQKTGKESQETPFAAVYLRISNLGIIPPIIDQFIKEAPNSVPKELLNNLSQLSSNLKSAIANNGAVVYAVKGKVAHEMLHRTRHKYSGFKATVAEYYKDFLATYKVVEPLLKRAYENYLEWNYFPGVKYNNLTTLQKEIIYEEAITHILDGSFMGLSLEEAATVIENDIDAYVEKNGIESISNIQEWVDEKSKQLFEAAKVAASESRKSDPSLQNRGKTAPAGNKKGVERDRNGPEETDQPAEVGDPLKERALPNTIAENTALDVEDLEFNSRYYEPVTRTAAAREASEWIREVGISQAIQEAPLLPPSALNTAKRVAVLKALDRQISDYMRQGNEGRARAVYDQLVTFSNLISPTYTEYGQAISQLAEWSYLDPDAIIYHLENRRARRGKARGGLSLETQEKLRATSAELRDLDKEISNIQDVLDEGSEGIWNELLRDLAKIRTGAIDRLKSFFGKNKDANDDIIKAAITFHGTMAEENITEYDEDLLAEIGAEGWGVYSTTEFAEADELYRPLRKWSPGVGEYGDRPGATYKNELRPGEDEYLLVNEKFHKQPEKIQKIITKALDELNRQLTQGTLSKRDSENRKALKSFKANVINGGAFYRSLAGTQKDASKWLYSVGIKGNKLEIPEQGRFNPRDIYVNFSAKDVRIIEQFKAALARKSIDELDNYTKGSIILIGKEEFIKGKKAGGQTLADWKSSVINSLAASNVDPTGAGPYLDSLYLRVVAEVRQDKLKKEIARVKKKHSLATDAEAREKLAEEKAATAEKQRILAANIREAKGEKEKFTAEDKSIENNLGNSSLSIEDIKLSKNRQAFYRKFIDQGKTPSQVTSLYLEAVEIYGQALSDLKEARDYVRAAKAAAVPGKTSLLSEKEVKEFREQLHKKTSLRAKKTREFQDTLRHLTERPETSIARFGDWYLRVNRGLEAMLTTALRTVSHNVAAQRGVKFLHVIETAFELAFAKAETKLGIDMFSEDPLGMNEKSKFTTLFLEEMKSSLFPSVRQALQKVKNSDAEILTTLLEMAGHKQRVVEGLLAYNPDLYNEMVARYSYGEDEGAVRPLDESYGSISRKIEKSVRAYEKVVHWATALNRLQEKHFKFATFLATLKVDLEGEGIDLDEIIDSKQLEKLPRDILERAIHRALEDTFSLDLPKSGSMRAITNISNVMKWIPVPLNPLLFRRFLFNSTKYIVEHSPLVLAKLATKKGFTRRDMAKMTTGMMMFTLALQLLMAFGSDDEDPLVLNIFGVPFKMTAYNPLSSFLILANFVNRGLKGKKPLKNIDELWKIFGIDTRYPNLALEWYTSLVDLGLGDEPMAPIKFQDKTLQLAGRSVAAYLKPISTLKDFQSQFDPEEATLRDYTREPFIGELKKNIPFSELLTRNLTGQNTPERINAISGVADKKSFPALAQLGITIESPSNIGAKFSPAEEYLDEAARAARAKNVKFYKSPEERKSASIAGQLYTAMDKGVDKKIIAERAAKYANEGLLSKNQLAGIKEALKAPDTISRKAEVSTIPVLVNAFEYATVEEQEKIKAILIKKFRSQNKNGNISSEEMMAMQSLFPELRK